MKNIIGSLAHKTEHHIKRDHQNEISLSTTYSDIPIFGNQNN